MSTPVSCRINDNYILVAFSHFLCRITTFSCCLVVFLFLAEESIENSRFQTYDLDPIEYENMVFIKRTLRSSAFNRPTLHFLIGISEVALHLLLIVVAFCAFPRRPPLRSVASNTD